MVATQAEKVLKAQNDLLEELNNKNDFAIRVATRTGRMTQEPLYPKGHPKRIEQVSWYFSRGACVSTDATRA